MNPEGHSELNEASTDYRVELKFPALHDSRYPVNKIADRLEPYLRVLVQQLHPEKVILFGSYAYGSPNEHSDFDLLINFFAVNRHVARGVDAEANLISPDLDDDDFGFANHNGLIETACENKHGRFLRCVGVPSLAL